jgi:hypothetical protein
MSFFSQFVKRYYKNGCFTGKYPIRRETCRFQFASGKVETYTPCPFLLVVLYFNMLI